MSQEQINLLRRVFFIVGIAGIIASLGMALYSCFVLRPKLVSVTGEIRDELQGADGFAARIEVEPLLDQIKAVLVEASHASVTTGKATDETKKGIAGAVLPKKEVAQSSDALKNTGHGMRVLAHTVGKTSAASPETLTSLRKRLRALDGALGFADLPAQAMLLGLGLSGLYGLIGFLSLGAALSLSNFSSAGSGSVLARK